MKNHHALAVICALMLPILANASMSIMKDLSGKVVAVDPWSYLDEDVMWTSTQSSNRAGGRVHGQLKMKYAIEDNNWRDSQFHNGSDSLTFVQGLCATMLYPAGIWHSLKAEQRTTTVRGRTRLTSAKISGHNLLSAMNTSTNACAMAGTLWEEARQSRTAGRGASNFLPIYE